MGLGEGPPAPRGHKSPRLRISLVVLVVRQLPELQGAVMQELLQRPLALGQLGQLPPQRLLLGRQRRVLEDPRPPAGGEAER